MYTQILRINSTHFPELEKEAREKNTREKSKGESDVSLGKISDCIRFYFNVIFFILSPNLIHESLLFNNFAGVE